MFFSACDDVLSLRDQLLAYILFSCSLLPSESYCRSPNIIRIKIIITILLLQFLTVFTPSLPAFFFSFLILSTPNRGREAFCFVLLVSTPQEKILRIRKLFLTECPVSIYLLKILYLLYIILSPRRNLHFFYSDCPLSLQAFTQTGSSTYGSIYYHHPPT